MQPRPLLAGGEVEVGLRPAPRPRVLGAVELGAAHPVLLGELAGVLDAHAPLLGGVDEEQATEAPERLPAEVLLALLVEQQHAATTVGGLRRGDETGQGGGARLEGGEHEGCLVEHSHTAGVVHALILPYRMVRRKCYALQAPQDGRTTDLETTSEER